MKLYKISCISVLIVLLAISAIEAKKNKRHRTYTTSSRASKTKTKTKWSTTTDLAQNTGQLSTEEHGYYVKRTYLPLNASANYFSSITLRSPPFLAVPIAWHSCEGEVCTKGNVAAVSSGTAALQEGFLCDDDCVDPYEPTCGKTPSELAVFYNKCKLNVARCRSHGLWLEVAFEECKKSYPQEIAYAERKFKSSPFFTDVYTDIREKDDSSSSEEDAMFEAGLLTLDKLGDQIAEAEAEAWNAAASSTVKGVVPAAIATPAPAAGVNVGQPAKDSQAANKPLHWSNTAGKYVKTTDDKKPVENKVNKPPAIAQQHIYLSHSIKPTAKN